MRVQCKLLRLCPPGDNEGVGIVLWIGSGFAAFLLARIVPFARARLWVELLATGAVAVLFGVLATALDFGGWQEPDWRAGLFSFFGAMGAVGGVRGLRIEN